MEYSYTSLIPIFSVFFLFLVKRKKYIFNKIFLSTIAIINIYFLIFVSGNRGAIISLMIFLTFLIQSKIKKVYQKIIFFSGVILSILEIYFNIEKILIAMNNFLLQQFGHSVYWLSKMITSITEGQDLDSGRSFFYAEAIKYFWEQPLLGNGIGFFIGKNRGEYVHNIILDVLCDTGIIGTSILILFLTYVVYILIFKVGYKDYYLILLLSALSIPRLMVSSTLWMNYPFWLLVVAVISRRKEIHEFEIMENGFLYEE